MLVDSVASTWSYCVGFPTWMLVTMPYDILQVCKTGVFDILNLLFVCSLLYSLMLSVCRGDLHVSIGYRKVIEYFLWNVASFAATSNHSPFAACICGTSGFLDIACRLQFWFYAYAHVVAYFWSRISSRGIHLLRMIWHAPQISFSRRCILMAYPRIQYYRYMHCGLGSQ